MFKWNINDKIDYYFYLKYKVNLLSKINFEDKIENYDITVLIINFEDIICCNTNGVCTHIKDRMALRNDFLISNRNKKIAITRDSNIDKILE